MFDVIVVGMGGAGCMASTILQNHDKSVLALEAMDRMGGRIHTVKLGDSFVELGAEWVHGTENNSVYDYAVREKVKLKKQGIVHKSFTSDGLVGNAKLLTELTEFSFSMLDQPPDTPEPLGQYITRRVKEYTENPKLGHDKNFLEYFLRWMNLIIGNHESCDNWDDVSTQTKYEELGGHLQMSWHKHGYKTLFDLMRKSHKIGYQPLDTKLNTEVVNIKLSPKADDPVEVTCSDGTVYHAQTVIVTVSLGVLKERHETLFTPALPEKKVKAINDISIGVVDKIVLLFEEVWWPTTATCFAFLWRSQELALVPEEDKWTTMIFGASLSKANKKCLVFWASGTEAKLMETLPEEEMRVKLMGILRRFMGKKYVIPEPIAMIRSNWHSNPFTRGSYSFDNIRTPEHPDARHDLGEPVYDQDGNPRLLFAGEATDKTHFSTVHGAIDSGKREAYRLLQRDIGSTSSLKEKTKDKTMDC